MKNNKDFVAFNRPKAWYSETSEPCGVLNEPRMTNYTLENCRVLKKERNQFAWACRKSFHHLPDALCQQVRALIDLRLPNCALIKERVLFGSFLPFDFDFIYFVLAWTQLGSMCRSLGALCECLVHSREFIFLLTGDLSSGCTAGSQRRQRVTERSNMEQRREDGAIKSTFMKATWCVSK